MIRELLVEIGEEIRLDRYLSNQWEDLSRSYLQKLLIDGRVLVNGRRVKSSYKISPGERITLELPEASQVEIRPEPIPLDILYEEKDLIMVNKPKGMVVHPGAGHDS